MNIQFINLSLGYTSSTTNAVHQTQSWCELCGSNDHEINTSAVNPDSVNYMGNAQCQGNQNFSNTSNVNWQNCHNFSQGGYYGQNANQHSGLRNKNQQKHVHSNQDNAQLSIIQKMLKQIMANQDQMAVDIKNQQMATKTLEVQLGQLVGE